MKTLTERIYADFQRGETTDMFVVTPEGNYFSFPAREGYDEHHVPVTVEDPTSHKKYLVIFDE